MGFPGCSVHVEVLGSGIEAHLEMGACGVPLLLCNDTIRCQLYVFRRGMSGFPGCSVEVLGDRLEAILEIRA